jgi:perosamine synthetase
LSLHDRLIAAGLEPVSAIHRTAWISGDARLGPGAQIHAGAIIETGVTIGRQCIVNTRASVDHECHARGRSGDRSRRHALRARPRGAGRVDLRGATVAPRVRIGADAIVAAGAVVIGDVPEGARVCGVPARPMKSMKPVGPMRPMRPVKPRGDDAAVGEVDTGEPEDEDRSPPDHQQAGPWITDHEIRVVEDCMRNGWYNYDYVEKFQREFAAYHDRKYGIMTPNCTMAIHLVLTALGIHDGDEVIVPECTWIASAAPITYLRTNAGLRDIEPVQLVAWIPPARARDHAPDEGDRSRRPVREHALHERDPRCRAPSRSSSSSRTRRSPGLQLPVDPGGEVRIASVFSFHRTKTLATGEGCMLLLDDDELYERCMFLRDHGRKAGRTYYNYEVTYKYMPFNLQAAMGYAQFQRIEELVGRKRWILQKYRECLAGIPDIQLNAEPAAASTGRGSRGSSSGRATR